MPSIITRGAFGASAFGFGGGTPRNLVTETFTSNATWVAPVGVSTVTTLSGKGSAGTSDYQTSYPSAYYAWNTGGPKSNPPFADWSTLYGNYQTALSTLAAYGPYPKYGTTLSYLYQSFFTGNSANEWTYYSYTGQLFNNRIVTGYTTGYVNGIPVPSSGSIDFTSLTGIQGFQINVGFIAAGTSGSPSTALGQTFPGGTYTGTYPNGTGNAATTTTYTNIAVTPGASYSIVVPSGGQVQISYYV